ncbi:phage tail protein [Neisseria sp. DTU_2021_1001991_1_SI_NGA_ILE_055]|uniref:phage tail protein n=1 Tax=Neisseria sp. DTU_2021_1001991_1_SI_NGA_ILE_055 TaxID=3077590 RepID=UPI0028EB7A61|nr:phage tail protein [Neisseria sp. DTU_2021_1001991_1_SI_NGA_ILE_055]WNS83233.1 phage tail protein [Neisseria sp. DTU_2021_1001991_1_SI_NGA_ILE_055]
MSDATYAGAIVMEVNGAEVEIISLKPQTTTGRKPVKTMNRKGRVLGYADGVTEHKLSVTAAIPIDGTEIDWDNITKAKITIYPINKEDRRTSYLDCFTIETSEQYEADNEARIDIEMQALHKVLE